MVFRSPHLPLDTPFWTRSFPLIMRSRNAGFPFATRARKREPCLQRYVSRMNRTENFLSKFFWKPLFSTFLVPFSLLAENIFSVFRSLHLPLDTLIKKSSCSWTFLLVYKVLKLKLKRPSKNNTITVYQSLKTSAHRNPRKCIILQDTAF